MKLISLIVIFIVVLSVFNTQALATDPDFNRNLEELITSKGYRCEHHEVVTDDGYILGVYRIPAAKGQQGVNPSPVILQHGVLDAGTTWVINSEGESLGFLLADAGYDVWIGNSRGNTYSIKHKTLDVKSKQFWAFSWDDMADYDVPAFVDYVLAQTNRTNLAWVGHSQGTTQMFAALSTNPNLSSKINLFSALAPVAHTGNATALLLKSLVELHVADLAKWFGLNEFLPSSAWTRGAGAYLCKPFPWLCENILFLMCGKDHQPGYNLNSTRMDVYIAHTPAGTSVQNMLHWAQGMGTGSFTRLDLGATANVEKYGQSTPPAYDLSQISNVKIALFTGTHDALADPEDVLWLLESLNPADVIHINNVPAYDHFDFVWGLNANLVVYADILKLLDQYSRQK